MGRVTNSEGDIKEPSAEWQVDFKFKCQRRAQEIKVADKSFEKISFIWKCAGYVFNRENLHIHCLKKVENKMLYINSWNKIMRRKY